MSQPPEGPTERTAELPPVVDPVPSEPGAPPPTDDTGSRGRGLPLPFALVLGGLVWWPFAFLPSLFGRGTDAPLAVRLQAPVPLIAGGAPLLLSCILVGGLLSGMLLRVCRGALLARILLGLLGLLITIGVSCGLSGAGSRAMATDTVSQSRLVSYGLIAVVLVATGLAWLIGLLALAGRAGWVVPAAGLAALAPDWLSTLIGNSVSLGGWLFAGFLGIALGLAAFRAVVALLWWIPAVGLAWFTTSAMTASVYSQQLIPGLSRRADLVYEVVTEVIIPCLQVFGQASLPSTRALGPWGFAVALGVVGLIAGRLGTRRRRAELRG